MGNQPERCEAWRAAQQAGTDNEGYGALLMDWGDSIHVGHTLPPVQFCPWCGTKLPDERHQ